MNRNRKNHEIEGTNQSTGLSPRSGAIVAGVSLLLMFVIAMFASLVHGNMVVLDDAAATANNILSNEPLFRLVVLSFLVIVILDVLVAWGLYLFFKPVNRQLSLLAAWLRVVYAAVFMVAILELGNALRILLSAGAQAILETDQLQVQALLALNAFSNGWDLGLAIFGLHLIVLGYLVFQSGYMPRILGALVLICSLGYLFDAVAGLLFPSFGVTVSQVTFIGEMLLGFWLLFKSISIKQWEKLTLEPAG